MSNLRQKILILLLSCLCATSSVRAEFWEYVDKKVVVSSLTIGLFLGIASAVKSSVSRRANTLVGIVNLNDLTTIDPYLKNLTTFADDSTIKAIILVIDSASGSLVTGNILYHELLAIKKKKPVIALIERRCCAAAYYVALAADVILASQLSEIGGIGASYDHWYFASAPEKTIVDLEHAVLLKGVLQADPVVAGSPTTNSSLHPLDEQERAQRQNFVDLCYEQFCTDIAMQRELPLDEKESWAVGVLPGKKACSLGLIDGIGTFSNVKIYVQQLLAARGRRVVGSLVFTYPKESWTTMIRQMFMPAPTAEMITRPV